MWSILLSWLIIIMFAVGTYLLIRFVLATDNGSGYPGIEDVYPWEYEKTCKSVKIKG